MKPAHVYVYKLGIIKNKNNNNSNKKNGMNEKKWFHGSWYSLLLGISRHYFRFLREKISILCEWCFCFHAINCGWWKNRWSHCHLIFHPNETHLDSSACMLNRKLSLYLWKTVFFHVLLPCWMKNWENINFYDGMLHAAASISFSCLFFFCLEENDFIKSDSHAMVFISNIMRNRVPHSVLCVETFSSFVDVVCH